MLRAPGEILAGALAMNYAVAAANVTSSAEVDQAIEAAEELSAPLILDVLPQNIMPCPTEFCRWILARCEMAGVPLALNLDDEKSFAGALRAIRCGATSVMVDRSALSFEENVAEVRKLTEIAHAMGVCVEAKLGRFGPGGEEDESGLTTAEAAAIFAKETGADCLAIAIRAERPGGPEIDFARLSLIKEAVGDRPLVLHGSLGIPMNQIQRACTSGINKVNLSKDLRAAALQSVLTGGNGDVNKLMKAGFKNKLSEFIRICGSEGRA